MNVERANLEQLVPQQGAMCLIDRVDFCDGQRIICSTMQHRSQSNPLRSADGLSSLHGIEFAAQAVAAHGALITAGRPRPREGLLLSARDCVFRKQRLDDIEGRLDILAESMGESGATRLYRFALSASGVAVVDGRVAVMLRDEVAT